MALVKRETAFEQNATKDSSHRQAARLPVASIILGLLSLAGMMFSIWLIFAYAPMDAVQGNPQRIFYFHVPSAWIGMLSFVIVAVGGIVYLVKKDERWDW